MKPVELCAGARVGANNIATAANVARMIPDDRNERMISPQTVAGRSGPGRRRQAGRRREVRTWKLERKTDLLPGRRRHATGASTATTASEAERAGRAGGAGRRGPQRRVHRPLAAAALSVVPSRIRAV